MGECIHCANSVYSKALCRLHYNRQYRHGDALWQPTQVKGMSKRRLPLYNTYWNMIKRCTNPNSKDYKNYGGRGITICARWMGPQGIYNFAEDMGDRPAGLTLERVDNNKGYSPSNCKWATKTEQNLNQRHIKYPYIHWIKARNKWVVRIQSKYVGIFKELADAERARDAYL